MVNALLKPFGVEAQLASERKPWSLASNMILNTLENITFYVHLFITYKYIL